MAKPQLNELFEWLKKSGANRFEIYDVDRNRTIEKCAGYEDLTAGGKTLEQYFIDLLDKGVKTIQLVKKRKNGSTYIREGCGLNYSLSTGAEDNVAASGQSASSRPATPQQYNSPGLMGAPSSFGLGFPEIMSMRSDADRFRETKSENSELKSKLERLEAENRKLETECLTYKFGADSKPSAVDKLVEALAANPSVIPSMIQSFKGGPPNPGLNSPQQPQLSDTKSQVVDTISNPGISDDHVAAAYYVLIEAVKGNQDFMNQYHSLLIKHNIISDGSDNNSDKI